MPERITRLRSQMESAVRLKEEFIAGGWHAYARYMAREVDDLRIALYVAEEEAGLRA